MGCIYENPYDMKAEDQQLLFKDLCQRLPYGVVMDQISKPSFTGQPNNVCEVKLTVYNISSFVGKLPYRVLSQKPILHPLSCLTKPITIASYNDGEPFVPIEELLKIKHADFYNEVIGTRYEDIVISKNHSVPAACFGLMATRGITVRTFPPEMPNNTPHYIIEKLNEWHINYRLPDHLFVPVTDEFNPY